MSRLTWFAAGALTGVYGLLRAKRAATNLTPDGLAARAAALRAGLQVLTSEVGAGMAERETQLREQLRDPLQEQRGIPPGDPPDVVPAMIQSARAPRHRRGENSEASSMQPTTQGAHDGHR
jgi:Family of unknown function (DUF6167)